MDNLIFVTGNMHKVHWVEKFLGRKLEHHKLDLDEIQSLDPVEVIEHKAKEAYKILQKPVLVEDTSVVYPVMGRLPGPFIKYFQEELGPEGICKLLDAYDDRSAVQTVLFGIFDGTDFHVVEGVGKGSIASEPVGSGGFGFDCVFIPEGSTKTRGQMTEEEYAQVHPRKAASMKLAEFLND